MTLSKRRCSFEVKAKSFFSAFPTPAEPVSACRVDFIAYVFILRDSMQSRALFLDRDGTLVYARHYPSHPSQLRLYPDIEHGLRRLQAVGFRLIVATNQPGLALGRFKEAQLQRMHWHLVNELAVHGVRLDGIYYCPHHPRGKLREWSFACDCRKPQPGMLRRAAADHDLALHRSWFIGDILDDIEAGNRVGCRTVLVDLGTESAPRTALRRPDFIARDTPHALEIVAAVEGLATAPDMDYLPRKWRRIERVLYELEPQNTRTGFFGNTP
jgi:D-glycero-D-manno-heptose 1,7-bisphosphate phosphatase